MTKWWVPVVVTLATLVSSFLFLHAWVISEYLMTPACCRDMFPSRAGLPDYYKYTVGPYLEKQGLLPEAINFQSQDDPDNSFRGSSVAAWLIRSRDETGGKSR